MRSFEMMMRRHDDDFLEILFSAFFLYTQALFIIYQNKINKKINNLFNN
jgi:hypothetical protein